MTEQVPLIEVNHLKKYFHTPAGQLHAVDDVSFGIRQGKTLGVVGESGCGKSTLGRTILRLLEPTSGEIFCEGQNITTLNKAKMRQMRQRMQIIFQDPYSSIDARMTVLEIIAEYMIVNRKFRSRQECYNQAVRLMDVVGLARRLANSYPHELDGGRRQRIGIARALSLDPKFIVCDEPVSALDVSIQAQILNLMMDLQEEMGFTYLFITHNLSVVKHISDEIMVMYLGQVIEKAEAEELFRHPLHPYTKALLAAIPRPSLAFRGRDLEVIRGEVTSPVEPEPGCRFAARCEFCTEACRKQQTLREITPGHWVSCWRAEEAGRDA